MATIIFVKNVTDKDVLIEELGFSIAPNEVVNLLEYFSKSEVTDAGSLDDLIYSGDLVVSDQNGELSIEDAIKHVNFETEYEDQDTPLLTVANSDKSQSFPNIKILKFNEDDGLIIDPDNPNEVLIKLASHFKVVTDDIDSITAEGVDILRLYGSDTMFLDYNVVAKSITFHSLHDRNLDGGRADSVYALGQHISGGGADSF